MTSAQHIIDQATARQKRASDVMSSVWVSASAGTGKTYVLTNRILQLLVEDKNLKPSQVLALTYTKAAAKEMENRLRQRLADWCALSDEKLHETLTELLSRPSTGGDCDRARELFALLLDDGLNMNTIHGFCQQILGRFPLESGVGVGFRLVEGDEANRLLTQAFHKAFSKAAASTDVENWAFRYYTKHMAEMNLKATLADFVTDRKRYQRFFRQHGGLDEALLHIQTALGIEGDVDVQDETSYINNLKELSAEQEEYLRELAQHLGQGGKTAKTDAGHIAQFLALPSAERAIHWYILTAAFFTKAGELRKKIGDKPAVESCGEARFTFLVDAILPLLMDVKQHENAYKSYLLTAAYLRLGFLVLQEYKALKKTCRAVDFDDLIFYSAQLLQDEDQSAWVRYKLDMNIAHILLDEAQDTDSEQWAVLQAIAAEFFAGTGLHGNKNRTFFAVGDVKQSIYRFRGAEPHVFGMMRDYLEVQRSDRYNIVVEELICSFRSTTAILDFTDLVFADAKRHEAVDDFATQIKHDTAIPEKGGQVTLWPLLEVEKSEKAEDWSLPQRTKNVQSGEALMAEKVATSIQVLLDSNELLHTTGKSPRPEDIMILLNVRKPLPALIAALDRLGIPHSGADRVDLENNAVVTDLIALLSFIADPADDLSLVTALRSPLFDFSGEKLQELCASRGAQQTLYQALCHKSEHINTQKVLQTLRKESATLSPYALLMRILALTNGWGVLQSRARGKIDADMHMIFDLALNWEQQQEGSLLGFIQDFKKMQESFKRDVVFEGGCVRILTVHSAKGLEAPIVYLPDAHKGFYSTQEAKRHVWQVEDDGTDSLFLHNMAKAKQTPLHSALVDTEKERVYRDKMRLLYVALTRAKEKLYIGGTVAAGSKKEPENNWYAEIKEAVTGANGWQELEDGSHVFQVHGAPVQPEDEEGEGKETVAESGMLTLPEWVFQNATQENKVQLRQASSVVHQQALLENVCHYQPKNFFQQGRFVHRLLEVLPTYAEDERLEKGLHYLNLAAPELSQTKREELVKNVLSVMVRHADLFGGHSRAEVPVAAVVGQSRIEGVIDRLCVTENEVWIIDYKTDTQVPEKPKAVYVKQLQTYVEAMGKIFPKHLIKAGIIWTSDPSLRLDWVI